MPSSSQLPPPSLSLTHPHAVQHVYHDYHPDQLCVHDHEQPAILVQGRGVSCLPQIPSSRSVSRGRAQTDTALVFQGRLTVPVTINALSQGGGGYAITLANGLSSG